jgi:hypothetical protein
MRELLARSMGVLVMAGLGVMPWAPDAHAILRIAATGDGGASTFIACDQNVCGTPGGSIFADTDPALGSLVLESSTAIGISVGQVNNVATPPFPGAPNLLSSSGVTVTNTTSVTVDFDVAISSTDFTPVANQALTTGSGTWSLVALGSSITMSWFNDPNNAQGAEDAFDTPGILLDTFTAFAPATEPFSFSHNGGPFAVNDPDPFSMTMSFHLTLTPGDSLISRGQAEIKPVEVVPPGVPLPSTLLLLGSGLGLFAMRAWKFTA